MKNTGNAAKFFIACAVIFGIGLLTAGIGAAFGGIDNFGKVAEKRGWSYGDPGDEVMTYEETDGFDAVDVNADIDITFITEKYYSDETWLKEHNITDILGQAVLRGNTNDSVDIGNYSSEYGHVFIVRGSKVEPPEVKVEKGVLHIDSKQKTQDKLNISLSMTPVTPRVYVFCPDNKLKSIRINEFSGDVMMYGVNFGKTSIDSASGDVLMHDVSGKETLMSLLSGDAKISGKLDGTTDINAESGDVDMEGRFLGSIKINVTSGDVEFDTNVKSTKYALDLSAVSGDLKISEGGTSAEVEEVPAAYKRDGAPNSLTIETLSGDIDVSF